MLSGSDYSNNDILSVKVHADLLANIVNARELRNKYQTNQVIKNVAFYYILKSLTKSGVIKDYGTQLHQLLTVTKCTLPTFYKRLRECKKAGYLKISYKEKAIVLASFSDFVETFDTVYTKTVNINYNYEEHKFEHLIEAAMLQLGELQREQVFNNKFKAQKETVEELSRFINPDENDKYTKSLKALQIEAFKHGHVLMDVIFSYNPDTGINANTMRNKFNFKSAQSVSYLKSKLVRAGIIQTEEQKTYCENYREVLTTNHRIKRLFVKYDSDKKMFFWQMPTKLHYAPFLQS